MQVRAQGNNGTFNATEKGFSNGDFGGKPKKSIFDLFKRKDKNKNPILDMTKKNSKFQVIEKTYFDGKKLNEREQKKISKQIIKYERQKPNKWEQNYLAMSQRGYPVQPDTARKYRHLAARVQRQKDKRTRKMERVYKKTLYESQGKRSGTNADVGRELKQKDKARVKRDKMRSRRLKRKQKTGHYDPFYIVWGKKMGIEKKKK